MFVDDDDDDDDDTVVVTPPGRDTGPIVLHLRSTDAARRAMRRSALRYAAKVLLQLGYQGASVRLQMNAAEMADAAQFRVVVEYPRKRVACVHAWP